ncbi:MAG: deoxyribose-phosphate aldolase [Gemmatimonadales bacterium]
MPLELDWVREARVNRSAVERRASTIGARRSVKKEWQLGWLLRVITLMDLTTLAGDDTANRVRRLAAKARRPLRADLLARLGFGEPGAPPIQVAALCVYHRFVATAVLALEGSGLPVAAVSAGFPAGLSPFAQRVAEIEASVAAGAAEIDIVITREHVLKGDWRALYDEVRTFREAAGAAHLKTILATGELGTLRNVYRASLVSMMAGADFIKTSTGKEAVNATLPVGLVMARAIRAHRERAGARGGGKPAGGVRTAQQSLQWLAMVKEVRGDRNHRPHLYRFGASGLVADVERQIEFHLTGRYSAGRRHGLG